MEDVECFSHEELHDSKRCRVSALRDFPPGCGSFAHLSKLGLAKEVASPRVAVEIVRDFPPLCGIKASVGGRNLGIMSYKQSSTNTAKTNVEQEGIQGKFEPETEKKICREKLFDISDDHNYLHEKDYESSELKMNRVVVLGSTGCGMSERKIEQVDFESQLERSNSACMTKGESEIEERSIEQNTLLAVKKICWEKPFDISDYHNYLHEKDYESSELKMDRVVVLGSMGCGMSERKIEQVDFESQLERSNSACMTKGESEIRERSMRDKGYSLVHDVKENHNLIPRLCHTDGCRRGPVGPSTSSHKCNDEDTNVGTKVNKTLSLFRSLCDNLLEEGNDNNSKGGRKSIRRVDLKALEILKDRKVLVNTGKPNFGAVPGVKVGEKFFYRVELHIIGLHRPIQAGIDFTECDGEHRAISIVASGGYANDLREKNSLIYTGEGGQATSSKKRKGGKVTKAKGPEDQKLKRGNIALINSVKKNPVRVIRGCLSRNGNRFFYYDGLYLVEKYWQERGPNGKLVFKFKLNRFDGENLLGN